jgi:hypothetical protein
MREEKRKKLTRSIVIIKKFINFRPRVELREKILYLADQFNRLVRGSITIINARSISSLDHINSFLPNTT